METDIFWAIPFLAGLGVSACTAVVRCVVGVAYLLFVIILKIAVSFFFSKSPSANFQK